MNVRNCRDCRKLFNYVTGPPICPACREKREEKFKDVKKFVQENPMVGISKIAEECDVEVGQIHQWIRESRLEFAENSPIGIPCESCGGMIRAGRYCDKCKNNMANTLGQLYKHEVPVEKKKERESDKIRFLDR